MHGWWESRQTYSPDPRMMQLQQLCMKLQGHPNRRLYLPRPLMPLGETIPTITWAMVGNEDGIHMGVGDIFHSRTKPD